MSPLSSRNPLRRDHDFYKELGGRLRAVRKSKDWSLAKVEEITRERARRRESRLFPAVVIGAYERGERRPDPDVLYALADLYEVPVSTFLPDDPSEVQVMVALADVIRTLSGLASGSPNLMVPVPRDGEASQ
jgi:transcriptional regulator with XRE-family HTH domain